MKKANTVIPELSFNFFTKKKGAKNNLTYSSGESVSDILHVAFQAIELGNSGIAIVDSSNRIKYVNRVFLDFLYINDSEKFINRNIETVLPEIKNVLTDISERLIEGNVLEEIELKNQDNSTSFFEVSISEINNDNLQFAGKIFYLTDITKRKEYEKGLIKANDTKSRLFSIIAHDLRASLGSIDQFFALLLENRQLENYNLLAQISKSTRSTFVMLENLLSWAQTQLNELRISPVSFNFFDLVNENLKVYDNSLQEKSIKVFNNLPLECNCVADKNTIDIVVRNLVSNAVKFTPLDGEILIDCTKDGNSKIQFRFNNSGKKIDRKMLAKIFMPHEHITTYGTNNEKGTGLGLMLCKNLTELNHGKIWIDDSNIKGNCFVIELPNQYLN